MNSRQWLMNTCWFATKAAIVKSLQTNDLQRLKIMKLSEKKYCREKTRGKGQMGKKKKRIARNSKVISQLRSLASRCFPFREFVWLAWSLNSSIVKMSLVTQESHGPKSVSKTIWNYLKKELETPLKNFNWAYSNSGLHVVKWDHWHTLIHEYDLEKGRLK